MKNREGFATGGTVQRGNPRTTKDEDMIFTAGQLAEDLAREEALLAIADQNDRFRRTWGADFTVPGQIVMTRSLADLAVGARTQIMKKVQKFDTFTEDNDPHGDHSFGAFEFDTETGIEILFWKIDLFDTDYATGSPNPADPRQTRRVLTIMRASEY